MDVLSFTAYYGDEQKQVDVEQPSGMGGGDSYEVFVNRFRQGNILKRNGKWIGFMTPTSELTAADIDILGEMIDKRENP